MSSSEACIPAALRLATFPNEGGHVALVVVRAIPFRVPCEQHGLPFTGVAHIGYLPGERILGRSGLARLVAAATARPRTPEQLAGQIAARVAALLHPAGAGAMLEAGHSCAVWPGGPTPGSSTVTFAVLGALRTDPHSARQFLALCGHQRTAG